MYQASDLSLQAGIDPAQRRDEVEADNNLHSMLTSNPKQCQNPRAEKLLTYCAQNHTLQSLTLIQSSGNISAKRLAHVKKLLTKYDSFRQIRHFDIRMDNPPSYPKFDFTCVLELCKYWPKLHILKIKCPGYDMEDSLNVVNFKALGMRSQSGTFMGRPYNFITHLHFGSSTRIAPSVVCEIGRYFPELEVGIFKNVGETQRILERVKHAPSFYEVVNPMPRLRQLQIGIYGNPDAKGENKAVSALFFSCIHQAPVLRKFTFEHMAWSPSKKMELFCALKKSGGSWKGMRREELRELTIRGWALEWDVLTHRGYRFELPNVVSVEAPDCSNIRKDVGSPALPVYTQLTLEYRISSSL